jgi:hypothetical protein
MQPEVTPEDCFVKAIRDLSSPLRWQINTCGKQEMSVLHKMDDILNNRPDTKKKRVNFKGPIVETTVPEPWVVQLDSNGQPVTKLVSAPRVGTIASPTTSTTQPATTSKVSLITKAVNKSHMTSSSGPTSRSKYAQALRKLIERGRAPQNRLMYMMELAQAILDDNPEAVFENANKVFDEETGQLLKYRKLITHPKYREAWTLSSANEFSSVGDRIKGTDIIFFIYNHQVPQDRWNDVTYAKFVCKLKPNKAEVH